MRRRIVVRSDTASLLFKSPAQADAPVIHYCDGNPKVHPRSFFPLTPTLIALVFNLSVIQQPAAAGENQQFTPQQYNLITKKRVEKPVSNFSNNRMNIAHELHTATLLPSGKVLVAGGQNSSHETVNTAELYDPATGIWMSTGPMKTSRAGHKATLLLSGKVIVIGSNPGFVFDSSVEIYDPATTKWSIAENMHIARGQYSVTLLSSGKVLVSGGICSYSEEPVTNNTGKVVYLPVYALPAELYDPATGKWTTTDNLNCGHDNHTATLLPNGRVLIVGGGISTNLSKAELFDPATGKWILTGALNAGRECHTATLLYNGKVLAVGGGNNKEDTLAKAELYDPTSGTWTETGALTTARKYHQAVLLRNGKVLIVGGVDNRYKPLTSAELYDPATGKWTMTGAMNIAREKYTMTLLPDGKVLVAGGSDRNSGPVSSVEFYNIANGTWTMAAY
jgi:large repetitive protein